MSKGRSQNVDSETQFLRSLQEVLKDLDATNHTYTKVTIKQTKRLGVFLVEFDTWIVVDKVAVGRLWKSDGQFPNSSSKTLAAYLFSEAGAHAIRVEEALRLGHGDTTKHWFGGAE